MADSKVSALAAASTLDGTELVPVVQGGVSKRATVAELRVEQVRVVTSNQASTSTSPASVTALEYASLAAGTYLMKYWICYQTAATTTGIEFRLNYTGTSSRLVATWYQLTTGGAAATGIGDQNTGVTAQMVEGKGQRASNAAMGSTQGVDTANADQFAVMEGILIATGTGALQLMFSTEVAGSAATIMSGTTLTLQKVA